MDVRGDLVALPDEISGIPLKKLLAGQISVAFHFHVISGLTALQGFVFSLFQTPRDLECTDFSGGVANGGRA
jgi:hypothetical protein